MAGPILQALAQGFTAKNILKALGKKSPKVGKYVALATAAGFSPHVTLKKLVQPSKSAAKSDDFLTQNERTRKSQKDNRRKELTEAIGVLGTAGAAAAGLYSVLGKESPIEAWKKGVLNSAPGSNPTSSNQPTPPPTAPQEPAALTESIQKEAPELIKEGMGSPAPEQHTPERERMLKIAENLPEEKPKAIVGEGIKPLQIDTPIVQIPRVETQFPHIRKFVDKHLAAGKSPEEIYENIQKSGLKGIADRHTQQTGQSYLDRIKELAGDQGQPSKEENEWDNFKNMGSGMVSSLYSGLFTSLKEGKDTFAGIKDPVLQRAKPYFDRGLIKSPEDLQKFVNQGPDSLSQEVITPLGVGTIHNEKGDNAFVKIDDKLHKIPKAEAEPIPKEWENISVDLTKVPESDRSAPLNFFASTPDRKSAFVRYWSGHKPMLYEYYRKDGSEFDEETLNSITNETDAPISSGMKFSGAWTQNGKSRGSANFHKLVKMAQEEGTEDDPTKPLRFKRINITFEHGFMKEYQQKLLKAEKAFDEFHKPPKRKKKSNS